MKNILIIIFIVFFPVYHVFSQTVDLSSTSIQHNDKQRDAILAEIEPTKKTVKNAWKNYLKDNYDIKLKGFGLFSNKDVLYAEDIKLNMLSDKRINLYTKFEETENSTKMIVFASFGYDIYFSSIGYSSEFSKMRKLTSNFLKNYLPKYYQNEINNTKEVKEELEEKIAENKEDISDREEEINKLKEEILSLENELKENSKKAEEINTLLELKKKDLEIINNELKNIY